MVVRGLDFCAKIKKTPLSAGDRGVVEWIEIMD